MEENKLIKTKEGIFSKIFRKIKLFFFKKTETVPTKEESVTVTKTNIKEELKVEVENDNSYQKAEFMKEISDNPSLLQNFSIDRLEKIKEYYEEKVKEKEKILANMKKA